MKQSILNLIFSFLSFAIGYGIALLTGLALIQEAVLSAYMIQWIAFIPAYLFQTEKFYDLTGSITYLTVVSYVSYHSYASMNVNINSFEKTSPYLPSGLDIMAVGNLPNELPRDASRFFGEQLIKYVLPDLVKGGNEIIQRATMLEKGKLNPRYENLVDYSKH